MKSLFSRLRHNKEIKENSSSQRPSSSRSDSNDDALRPGSHRASSYTADRPHAPIAAFHSQSSSGSSDSLRPHSIAGDVIYEDETIRARTLSGENAGVKKVTFRSPAPTPATSLVLEEMPMYDTEAEAARGSSQTDPGTSIRPAVNHQLPRPPSASSRSASRQSFPNAPKSIITRKPSLPGSSQPSMSPTKSMLSPTPSEQSLAGMSTRSYLPPPNSWSEMAEDDLIANLGPRERTRQEVLWEIVSSEERCVRIRTLIDTADLQIRSRVDQAQRDVRAHPATSISPLALARTFRSRQHPLTHALTCFVRPIPSVHRRVFRTPTYRGSVLASASPGGHRTSPDGGISISYKRPAGRAQSKRQHRNCQRSWATITSITPSAKT